jgi:hypothetical protein
MKTTEQKKNLQNKQILPVANNVAKPIKTVVQREQRFDSSDIPKSRRQK